MNKWVQLNPKGLSNYSELLEEQSKEWTKIRMQKEIEELIIKKFRENPEGFRDWVDENFNSAKETD